MTGLMNTVKFIRHFVIFSLLTVITQIGGIVYLLNLFLHKNPGNSYRFQSTITFITLYVTATYLIVPKVAPLFGREKVRHSGMIQPANHLTALLNRNYVNPELNTILGRSAENLFGTNIKIHYLDANFPFIDGFPLMPHLSHNDGNKIDISFVYQFSDGKITNKLKSVSGYGIFERPESDEVDWPSKCIAQGYNRYGFSKYLSFGEINKELIFSEKGTRELIQSLLKNIEVKKIFIEPHLKRRLNLKDPRIRFQGCHSVRHDDHIHLQL